jgi:hypothetical protein
MEHGPIFVGGLNQSGKTLMRLALSSHPNIAMSRRTYMWTRFYRRYGNLNEQRNFERCLQAMLKHKPMQMLQPDAARIRREFRHGEPTYARLFALFHQHYAERVGKGRWGDQLGAVERYADPIFQAYPGAKMIHMVRDPRDRYEAAVPSLQRRRGKVGGVTDRWRASVALARRNLEHYVDSYLIVRYEALVQEPEQTLRDVCAFVGETFVPGMLTFEDAMRFGADELVGFERRAAATTATGERASGVMSQRELAFIQAYAGREMCVHGYQLKPIHWSLRDRVLFYGIDWPTNVAHILAWRTLEANAE